ncbi:hypothetical protein SAMN04487995_1974 [Dyadobacter koreensis]|uniref:GAF domain-containing protein n=1 Tax=Dyadobacter koreensis TaxID=408657 RepID=A0A1H6T2D4_9BACT|nr:GAF domain-containing protein [Dyadobacter koreensis]SEI74211.1 hypothetical protein SAMN04487995_1974 [Dyadobacter koreensis]
MNLSLETPFKLQLCFDQVIEKLEKSAADSTNEYRARDQALLDEVLQYPELRNGITDMSQINELEDIIARLLAPYFAKDLTLNEIKAVNIPYAQMVFNHTQRFKNILKAAGPDFNVLIRDFDEHQFYVISCCMILYEHYGASLDFNRPFFYDIPTAKGIIKHYRILYNADFLEIMPTERSLPITQEDIDLLMDSYDNLDLWKSKFPKDSWLLKGFSIMTLFDATIESAVSLLKEKLLAINAAGFRKSIESIFQSIYQIPGIQVGFTVFNHEEDKLSPDTFGQQMPSFILQHNKSTDVRKMLCDKSKEMLIVKQQDFAVSDTEDFLANNPESPLAINFLSQNIQSFILAPIAKNGRLFGILEVVSHRKKELHSVNVKKLEIVMPFLVDSIERLAYELQNQVQAVIQDKYTSIHESVLWKFHSEAQQLIDHRQVGEEYDLKEITFPDVFPLYGQIDIKGSSEARNSSVQKDLKYHLKSLLLLLQEFDNHNETAGLFQAETERITSYLAELALSVKASTEQYINSYLEGDIHLKLYKISHPELAPLIQNYFAQTHKENGDFHIARRKYEMTISKINNKVAAILDKRQTDAQSVYPHYYERFKTDGVEHNLYIGQSIAPKIAFHLDKLYAIRLWQLRVLCEMEIAHSHIKPYLPYPLDVTTLVLVYHSTIDIRFRMDEKRFDVHGSYNTRFEIVKKRIDKACILGTNERITQVGHVTIVYSNDSHKEEYVGYIKLLQAENLLEDVIEKFEIEDLQGISGLKALRIKLFHQ